MEEFKIVGQPRSQGLSLLSVSLPPAPLLSLWGGGERETLGTRLDCWNGWERVTRLAQDRVTWRELFARRYLPLGTKGLSECMSEKETTSHWV